MFAIHYYMDKTLVAVEGPVSSKDAAQSYLDNRSHYLDFKPRIVSMNALRMTPQALSCPTRIVFESKGAVLPAPAPDRRTPQPHFA
jgi:hypothetical protein